MEYDDGMEIPAGYHLRTKVRGGLIGGGAGLLGGLWIISIITGAVGNAGNVLAHTSEKWTAMYVPVVGPFITMGTAAPDLSSGGNAILAVDGVAQVGGLAMIILGIVLPKKTLVRDDVSGGLPTFELPHSVKVTPVAGLKSFGVVGSF